MSKNDSIKVKSPIVYIVSLCVTFIWLVLIFIGPLLYKLPENFTFLADIYYFLFHFTCHQFPQRCYWLFDYQLPVCVRCLGIYLGAFLGLLIMPIFMHIKSSKFPSKWWLILCFLPIGIDGISSTIHLYSSPHWLRLITGLLCGGVAMLFILPGLNELASSIERAD